MKLSQIKKLMDYTIAGFCISVMVALLCCVVWQVFSRYILSQPSTITDEMARFLMIWVGLLGAAYTVGAQKHLSIDLLSMSLSQYRKHILAVIVNIFVLSFSSIVIIGGGLKLIDKTLATSQVSAAMQIPMGYIYIALPLSGAIIAFYSIYYIIVNSRKIVYRNTLGGCN